MESELPHKSFEEVENYVLKYIETCDALGIVELYDFLTMEQLEKGQWRRQNKKKIIVKDWKEN
jgi:hypothetical protein